jgi:hypothetical protein
MKAPSHLLLASLLALVATLASNAALAQEPGRIVVKGFEADDDTMSLQTHISTLSVSDDTLDVEGSASLGGFGLSWRWELLNLGSLELFGSFLFRLDETALVSELRSQASVSWLWHLWETSGHRLYGITGFGALHTTVSLGENATYDYAESGLVLGIGSEWLIDDDLIVTFDVRSLLLESDGPSNKTPHPDGGGAPAPDDGIERRPYPESWYTAPESRSGLMFNIGFGYRL